jgi:hypothetical protein
MAAAALQELASHRYRSKFVGAEHAAAPFWLLHPLFSNHPLRQSRAARRPPDQGSSPAAEMLRKALTAGVCSEITEDTIPYPPSPVKLSPIWVLLRSIKSRLTPRLICVVFGTQCLKLLLVLNFGLVSSVNCLNWRQCIC